MLPSLMTTQTFSRLEAPMVSDHGKLVPDPSQPLVTTGSFVGSIQPGTGATDPINRNGAEVVMTIWTDLTAALKDRDFVGYNGDLYFVNGAPERWETGILDHQVVHLSFWEG